MLASSGMQADIKTLHKILQARVKTYEYVHRKTITTSALAQMLSNALYYKRFFPYYAFNILAGLDETGSRHSCPPQYYEATHTHTHHSSRENEEKRVLMMTLCWGNLRCGRSVRLRCGGFHGTCALLCRRHWN